MADLELTGIRKSFGPVEILHGIDLAVRNGEFCVFVGPSGCGKSTLLRLVAGLEEVTEGKIAIDGRDVTDVQPAQRGIAMVFQSYALYPHMDVYENMAFGLKRARYPKTEIEQRVQRAARTLHIENLLKRRPRDLSGGQRQRVAIGRAIVREPKLFLFDEPLSNLDAALRVEMRVELAKLKAELGATIVYVTHDQIEAMTLADRIVVMNDGRVEQSGAPLDLYHAPANLFVAGFIGSPKMNFVPAQAVAMQDGAAVVRLLGSGTLALPVTQPIAPGAELTLGVRPEHLRLAGDGGLAVPGEIVVAELLGGESYLHVRVPGQTVVVKTDGGTTPHRGDRIEIVLPPAQCHLFGIDGQRISGRPEASPSGADRA